MDASWSLLRNRTVPQFGFRRYPLALFAYPELTLFSDLAARLARFAVDYREAVQFKRPELPDKLNDRAQDNWEPLLAIAEVAGDPWPKWGKAAALKLSGTIDTTLTLGTELLADIKQIFETKNVDRISTIDLIEALREDDEQPWATYNRGKPITPRQVNKRLNGYGIKRQTIRIGYKTAKGFLLEQFEDAFARYLPPIKNGNTETNSPQPSENEPSHVTDTNGVTVTNHQTVTGPPPPTQPSVTDTHHVTETQNVTVTLPPPPTLPCYPVTDKTEGTGQEYMEVEL